jgi:glycosyltransferase involved in cell wall biosynthesis
MNAEPARANERTSKLLISAFGIHMGGGLVLLRALLGAASTHTRAALLDSRLRGTEWSGSANVQVVRRSFLARIGSLQRLAARADQNDLLLCFNSLPPLRKTKAYVVNYVHAPHFVGAHSRIRYSLLTTWRIAIERLWFRLGIHNCDEVWVQTQTMSRAMRRLYPHCHVRIVPLVDDALFERLSQPSPDPPNVDYAQFSFFYPADGVGHKGHGQLLAAWKMLAEDGKYPRLFLTLQDDEMRAVQASAGIDMRSAPRIENLGRLSRERVLECMQTSSALIFPSRAETFGLPLLEARAFATPILASERDFVRDVCAPQETFDPESPPSIALAVQRFVTGDGMPRTQFYSARKFVDLLLSCGS